MAAGLGYTTPSAAQVTLYQPQIDSWPDHQHMTLFAAVSYLPNTTQKPVLGTLKIEAETQVALDDRLVNFSDFKITLANFPSVPKEQIGAVVNHARNSASRGCGSSDSTACSRP